MEDDVRLGNQPGECGLIGRGTLDEREPGMAAQRREIGLATGREVVEYVDPPPGGQQLFGQVRADEPRSSGHQRARAHAVSCAITTPGPTSGAALHCTANVTTRTPLLPHTRVISARRSGETPGAAMTRSLTSSRARISARSPLPPCTG